MIINGFSFSESKRIPQISICYGENCSCSSLPWVLHLEEPGKGQQLCWEFQQSFTKLSPSGVSSPPCVLTGGSESKIPKQSWRSPQCRESCQEQGLEKPASDPVNPGCTCLCPDPELALPEEAEGVNGTGLEPGEAQDQAPR